jgi:hypothetical protein
MGLPVPGIFLYKEANTNVHLVIDGQQRLQTLQMFYDRSFKDRAFRLDGVRDPWAGKTYDELDPADVLKLDDSIIHATIFKQDSPYDVLDSIYYVFERINSGGVRLSPQEIRNCIIPGPFIDLVRRLNQNAAWRRVFGPVNNRSKDEEFIVRFFALHVDGSIYKAPMNQFLNDFSNRMNQVPAARLGELESIFVRTIAVVLDHIERPFRRDRALNAAVFDSVMAGIAHRVSTSAPVDGVRLAAAYRTLLNDDAYRAAVSRATAREENVRTRLDAAIRAFATV